MVVNQSGIAVQSTNYYPFGAQQADAAGTQFQPYKYTDKEYDQTHGLNLYDYGARFYDSGLGRFLTMDPLAKKFYSVSPYAYCADNPVRFVDPDRKKIVVGTSLGRFFAYMGFNNFESKAQKQIDQLRNMDENLKVTIDYLENSKKQYIYMNFFHLERIKVIIQNRTLII